MPKHNVFFELPKHEMGKVDADFFIQKDGMVLGRIRIQKAVLTTTP